mgnify:CR=1 FL=1
MYNCPNCGAPITGTKCEYCGTVFNAEAANRAADGNEHCVKLDNYIPFDLGLGTGYEKRSSLIMEY